MTWKHLSQIERDEIHEECEKNLSDFYIMKDKLLDFIGRSLYADGYSARHPLPEEQAGKRPKDLDNDAADIADKRWIGGAHITRAGLPYKLLRHKGRYVAKYEGPKPTTQQERDKIALRRQAIMTELNTARRWK